MRLKMKSISQRYDINRLWSKHGQKYTKYQMGFIVMVVTCIKEHLSNTWSSIHEEVKQH